MQASQINLDPPIRVLGYISGEILEVGPDYTSFIGSSRAQQRWVNSWQDHYTESHDLEQIRKIDEEFTAIITAYGPEELARLRDVRRDNILAWRPDGGPRPSMSNLSRKKLDEVWGRSASSESSDPKICLCSRTILALAPPSTRVGDVIVRFFQCDCALVMRPTYWHVQAKDSGKPQSPSFVLIGTAATMETQSWKENDDRRAFDGFAGRWADSDGLDTGSLYMDLDLPTLQPITAFVVWKRPLVYDPARRRWI